MPNTLLETSVPRTLIAWTDRFARPEWRGAVVEGWLFEGAAARRGAEERLQAAGVQARLRSAYKPLLHFFLEEVDRDQLAAVTVRYPVHPLALPGRFMLEAYPLAAMLPALRFEPGGEDLHYEVSLAFKDGRTRTERVFAPNREHEGAGGAGLLSPTGWLRVRRQADQPPQIDERHETVFETLFARMMQAVRAYEWPAQEPYFERLDIRVDLPGIDEPLPLGHECVSTLEALHEDIYFSLLEFFQERSGRVLGDRRLQPGQIVPDVRATGAAPRLRITRTAFASVPAPAAEPAASAEPPLEALEAAPTAQRVARELQTILGQRFAAGSRQGRPVEGVYHQGKGAAVFVSGGQHANETSGVVGALRAAQALQQQLAHFAVLPLENPDGYALQRELAAQNPRHMLHAARYSALGDDIEYREQPPLYERAARDEALALSGAQLHVNLHGYPAHEWTRPLSGYLPQGFELWTIPKGFFLIVRHHAGWEAQARALMEQVSAALAQLPGLAEFNARQLALYERHAGKVPFQVLHGTACALSKVDRPGAPVTLITEFPDETVHGEAFRFAHTVQTEAALAAVRAWQSLARR
ncbi:peptidase M14 [Ramlibacter sp.]|uniref:peptidase M14 n=1 Tax=Ramlibacter sp. TaxID=1917967 RepID=UPI002C8F0EFD|nr:peptidase M14 [Ramlibacter sp.]HWI83455.1 peptidase M14 [Ramlibacter sp.]